MDESNESSSHDFTASAFSFKIILILNFEIFRIDSCSDFRRRSLLLVCDERSFGHSLFRTLLRKDNCFLLNNCINFNALLTVWFFFLNGDRFGFFLFDGRGLRFLLLCRFFLLYWFNLLCWVFLLWWFNLLFWLWFRLWFWFLKGIGF